MKPLGFQISVESYAMKHSYFIQSVNFSHSRTDVIGRIPGIIIAATCFTVSGAELPNPTGITNEMLGAIKKEYGRRAQDRIIRWQYLEDKYVDATESLKLSAVNLFVNRNRYISDLNQWQKADYWSTPIEFLSTRRGDCEEFAITKYVTLRSLNVPDEKLRITYVKVIPTNKAHMVLSYYESPRAIPLVLDNLIGKIMSASERTDLKLIFSF